MVPICLRSLAQDPASCAAVGAQAGLWDASDYGLFAALATLLVLWLGAVLARAVRL